MRENKGRNKRQKRGELEAQESRRMPGAGKLECRGGHSRGRGIQRVVTLGRGWAGRQSGCGNLVALALRGLASHRNVGQGI